MKIKYEDFEKIHIHVGTILSVKKNKKAKKPALILNLHFGDDIGIKKTSAQITQYYNSQNLIGKQVIAICNLPNKNIAGVISEVLVLGSVDKEGNVVLLHPSQKVQNGLKIS